jgi:site-specific recombinase XerD
MVLRNSVTYPSKLLGLTLTQIERQADDRIMLVFTDGERIETVYVGTDAANSVNLYLEKKVIDVIEL